MPHVSAKSKMFRVKPKPEHERTARLLREFLQREGMSMAAFARLLGCGATLPYAWIAGKGTIGRAYRPAVASLLGVPEGDLAPDTDKAEAEADTTLGPARQAVRLAKVNGTPTAPPMSAPPQGGRLAYEGHGDGTATISVRARLPVDQAKPLFRLLLDSGVDMEQVQASA